MHVLNYTNPAMHRGWIRDFLSDRRAEGADDAAAGQRVTRVELLRAGRDMPFTMDGDIEFTIPRVLDYEVAALHS